MRINCHAHLFNLKSVFTEQTIHILINRLSREKWGDTVADAAAGLLKQAVKEPAVDEDQLLRDLAASLAGSTRFRAFVADHLDELPMEVRLLGDGGAADLASGALRQAFGKLNSYLQRKAAASDAANQDLWDLIDFLRILLLPDISDVTDRLMGQLDDDDAVVALMMDITTGDGDDDELFTAQTAQTADQVLRYPGRVFPFFCVNTRRKDTLARMVTAIGEQGFVGVKLYPSLGYAIDDPRMEEVYAWCEKSETPLLMHCSKGGFYESESSIGHSDPAHWEAILARHPELRICFAHFGGDGSLVRATIPANSWTRRILKLMERYPGVYTDISYHVQPMNGKASAEAYRRHLTGFLAAGSPYRDRILFGTDYHVVRRRLREDNHWRFFEDYFTRAQFKRIAETNPRRFLGLPASADDWGRENIQRYVDFVVAHADRLEHDAPAWLQQGVRTMFQDPVTLVGRVAGTDWSRNNFAHVETYKYFRDNQMYSFQQRGFDLAHGLKLRQLQYWNKEHEAPEIFNRKCRNQAVAVDVYLRSIDVKYEAGQSRKRARKALIDLFKQGGTTLADFAAEVDRRYRFVNEVDLT